MTTVQGQLQEEVTAAFKMLAAGLASVQTAEADGTAGPAHLTARRLILHSLQAFENYLGDTPPHNYGALLKYGKRDALPAAALPSCAAIAAYAEEVRTFVLALLHEHDDRQLLDEQDLWQKSEFWRASYCIRHAHQHLGHVDQLLYSPADPRGWRCFSYRYDA